MGFDDNFPSERRHPTLDRWEREIERDKVKADSLKEELKKWLAVQRHPEQQDVLGQEIVRARQEGPAGQERQRRAQWGGTTEGERDGDIITGLEDLPWMKDGPGF